MSRITIAQMWRHIRSLCAVNRIEIKLHPGFLRQSGKRICLAR